MLKNKTTALIILSFLTFLKSHGQYLISGYVEEKKNSTVYISLIRYDEEFLISGNQVLFSTKTDSLGHFKFQGQLLSQKNKIYRIHCNTTDNKGFQFVQEPEKSNFHNFIFSNTDTIFFKKSKKHWFSNSQNTNTADQEWYKLKSFVKQLKKGVTHIKNKEVKQQITTDFSEKTKHFSNDSIQASLVKLLAFSTIKKNNFNIEKDFIRNPDFYNRLLTSLQNDYSQKSYYLQYKEELSKITNLIILRKYKQHKIINYILVTLLVVSLTLSFFLFRKLKKLLPKDNSTQNLNLTNQEEKIAKLICEHKTNKEIAEILFISLSTVKTHIRNLYNKLEVNERKEFIRKIKIHLGTSTKINL